jgi:hypothetical protein
VRSDKGPLSKHSTLSNGELTDWASVPEDLCLPGFSALFSTTIPQQKSVLSSLYGSRLLGTLNTNGLSVAGPPCVAQTPLA